MNALKAVELIFNNLEKAYIEGGNIEARSNMLLGSMLAGYAFNSALLGLVHAIAHPLSAHCGLPHGVANACGLPYVMEYNAQDPVVQKKYNEIAQAMGLNTENLSEAEGSKKAIEAVKKLAVALEIPSLDKLGIKREQLNLLAEETLEEEVSMMTTPVDATKDDVLKILEKAFIGEGVKIK
ncbi:iron-containing alcohol dehydrogenase [Metabacillus sp. BG109]|uniref:Iron-containing alcohol dehydrogenase n=1 Tax=Metabacillus bambusae TaxID=2795218 RepID=A0ABS3MZS0_9BACI|nr:iron-containing alcohol dehydrogenase [Metabacillus bambusae]